MEDSAASQSFGRVLIVEDDDMQRRTLTELLQEEGFEVIACRSAGEALREFEQCRARVAILDLRLPDLTGVQLLDRLGECAEHASIIINTAYSSYESARDALNFGAFAYVEKAGEPEELLRHVHRAVAHQLRRVNERLEAAVSENRAHLASVFRAAPIGIGLVCDRTLREVNDRLCEMTGYRPEELIGRDSRLLYVSEQEYESAQVAQCEATGAQAIETRWKRQDGEILDILLSCTRLDPENPAKGVTFTALDITQAKRAEAKLVESEERYRGIFENAVLGLYRTTPDGRILAANSALVHMLGYDSFEELAQRNLERNGSYAPGYPRSTFKEMVTTSGRVVGLEAQWLKKDGSTLSIRENAKVVRDDQGRVLFYEGTVEDITARKRAEEALRQNEQLLRSAEQIARVGSFGRDLHTDEAVWSDELYRIFGYEPGEVTPSMDLVLRHIHPDDRDKFAAAGNALHQEGRTVDIEYRVVRKDGQLRIVHCRVRAEFDDSGRLRRRYGTLQDVTERHEAEAALRESEARFRQLAELLPQTVFEIDAEGRFTFVNHCAFESFGYDYEELAYLDLFRLFVAEDHERLTRNLRQKPEGGPSADHEYTARRKNGTTFPVLLYSAPIMKDGEPAGLRGIALDISERQRAEEALQESKAKLESILESSPNAIIVIGLDETVDDCNQATLGILGLVSKEEIIGHPVFEFVAPQHVAAAREKLAEALERGSSKDVELMLLRPPGNTFVAEISASVMRNAEHQPLGVVLVAADITERKRAAERLLAASSMLDLAPSSITVHDSAGRFLYANRKTFEIHGYPEPEFMALTLHQVDVPESAALIAQRMERIAAQGEASFEVAHFRKDGSSFPMEVYVKRVSWDGIDALLSIGTDITGRKQAEEALRRSDYLLRESQKIANIGHYALDTRTGTWESSEILDAIFGIEKDFSKDVDGWLRLVHPDHRDEMSRYLSQHVLREHHPFDCEYRIVRLSDGAVRWVWGLGRLESGPDGEPIRMIGVIQDITERKEAEERLLAYQAKLKSLASELSLAEERERRRIAGDLHDHACQGLALSKMKLQAVLDRALPADEPTLREICVSLDRTIESVRELTFDLSSPTLYKFGLVAALEELLHDKLKAEYRIKYHFCDDGTPKPLAPDVRVLLFQSVRELIINVIKHARAQEVRLDIRREGNSIRVDVCDDGTGFDVERVWSTSSQRRSVGLFNVRERLDFIGGHLEIDTQPGRGSRFTLRAPLETRVHVAKENRDGSEDSTR
ncbi:MAG: PAS domain S-box protein [Sedimentisphaerales bacterium]|nr:PAS domain S-box protein [Sedimentisphaerales bacterium]